MRLLVQVGNDLLLAYFVVLNVSYLLLIGLAFVEFGRAQRRRAFSGADELFRNPLAPSVSLLVPAHDEGPVIVPAVHALTALRYPRFQVIVIDDGSTDDTFERLRAGFDLVEVPYVVPHDVPNRGEVLSIHVARNSPDSLLVARKRNGGKADALNVGINLARHELVCMVDADSILDHDALLHVVKPFTEDPLRVVATGGVVGIVNGCKVAGGRVVDIRMPRQWLTRIQIVEYLRAFLTGRTGWSRIGGLIVISGAFGLFRRDTLVRVGGMSLDTVGEDAEVVVRLHRRLRESGDDYRVVFLADPISWSQAPTTLRVLGRQRRRWHRGLAEVLQTHRVMIGNPRYGRIGLLALPYYLFFELLAPFVELFALFLLPLGLLIGAVDLQFAWRFLLAAYGYGILVSLAALTLEELSFHRYRRWRDVVRGLIAAVLENVGYRQVLAPFQIRGAWLAWRKREAVWGGNIRTDFDQQVDP
ncbi:glycosyltransferase family 2 protein [Actinoplanes sp. KI2]|uniref:glycosyltransferase family 2 protein n=1 Tax=Actinoplanes sp. KI2 TaxID=2983315 RepID=UPI0021D60E99|nr:glycosyltransferase [Actinoplanes sp. KI2]MCU7722864.1 glycosyltransferase family 2 protein [Actinoplanes sp. KI2]